MVQISEASEAGVPAGLAVATPGGWRDMRALRPGALIWAATGAVRLLGLRRSRGAERMLLPPGALGNRNALWLPPGLRVLIDCDMAEAICGEALVLVPVAAAEGWRGVRRVAAPASLVVPLLERAAVIHAGPGMMLACPGIVPGGLRDGPGFAELSEGTARQMLASEMAEEAGVALAALRRSWSAGR